MSFRVTPHPDRLLLIDVRRSVQSGLVRAASLGRYGAVLATVRLENAVFQPKAAGFDLTASGVVRIAFPNPRTLHLASLPIGHSVARGLRVAQFGPVAARLRNLPVQLDEQAVALVGEMSHSLLPGELALAIRGQPRIARLSPHAASVPFVFPLSQPDEFPKPIPSAPKDASSSPPITPRRSAMSASRSRRRAGTTIP